MELQIEEVNFDWSFTGVIYLEDDSSNVIRIRLI